MLIVPKRLGPEVLLAAVAVLSAGCGQPAAVVPAPAGGPVFYPAPPALPRVQFLTSFSSVDELTGRPSEHRSSGFEEFIIGKAQSEAPQAPSQIKSPYGIAARNGRLYICDLGLHCVHVVDVARGTYSTLGSQGDLKSPVNITLGPQGRKYVCDTGLRKVAVFGADDRLAETLGDPTRCAPSDLAIRGEEFIVADIVGGGVQVWSKEGTFLRMLAHKGNRPGQLRMPTNLTVAADGRILVSDTGASIVNIYSPQGEFLGSVGAPGDRPGFFGRPKGLALDAEGRLFVADAHWEVVQVFSPEGRLLLCFGGPSAKPQGMGMPAGVAVDATSISAFRRFIHPDFEAEYLFFVANQFGKHKIGVYAFGRSRSAGPTSSAPGGPTASP